MLETSCLAVVWINCAAQHGPEGIVLCLGENKHTQTKPHKKQLFSQSTTKL